MRPWKRSEREDTPADVPARALLLASQMSGGKEDDFLVMQHDEVEYYIMSPKIISEDLGSLGEKLAKTDLSPLANHKPWCMMHDA